MKKTLSIILAASLLFCAALFAGCGKKHEIHTDLASDGFSLATAGDGVVYVPVTDLSGEAVTDAEGETVTEAVESTRQTVDTDPSSAPVSEPDTTRAAEQNVKNDPSAATTQSAAKTDEPTTAAALTVKSGEYVLTVVPDKTEVKAGDTVVLTYHLKNCKNVACCSFTVEADKRLSVTNYKSKRYTNDDDENFDIYSNDTDKGVLFSGMIATTCDFMDADLFTVSYLVGDQVKKGDKLVFRVVPTTFLVGDDSSGKNTRDYAGVLSKATAEVTVS